MITRNCPGLPCILQTSSHKSSLSLSLCFEGVEAEEEPRHAATTDGEQETEGDTQMEDYGEGGGAEDGSSEPLVARNGREGEDVADSPCLPSKLEDEGGGGEEEEAREEGAGGETWHPSNTEEEEAGLGLDEKPTASFSSCASEMVVLHDATHPTFQHQANEQLTAGSSEVGPDKSDTAKAAEWQMSQDEDQMEQVGEEEPLDWEALAREVEAEWVMEGSGDESELSYPVASPPMSPDRVDDASAPSVQNSPGGESEAGEEDRPPLDTAAGVSEASSECIAVPQQQIEGEEGDAAHEAGDRGAHEVREIAPPPAAGSPDLRQENQDNGAGSGVVGGRSGGDAKSATPGPGLDSREDSKEANNDSDCGSPFPPAASKGQGVAPAIGGQISALPDKDSPQTRRADAARPAPLSSWARKSQQSSTSTPLADSKKEKEGGEEKGESEHRVSSGTGPDPMDDDDARSAASEEVPKPPVKTALDSAAAPAGKNIDGAAPSGLTAEPVAEAAAAAVRADGSSAEAHDDAAGAAAAVPDPTPAPAAPGVPQASATRVRDSSKGEAGSLVAAGPGKEAGKGGGRGGCAAGSCGCVLM